MPAPTAANAGPIAVSPQRWVWAALRLFGSATDKRYRLAEYRAERKNGTTTSRRGVLFSGARPRLEREFGPLRAESDGRLRESVASGLDLVNRKTVRSVAIVLAAITQFGALGPGVEMHHNRRWTAPTRRWCGRTTLLGIGMVPQRSRPSASARLPAQSGTNGAAPEQFCTCGRRWPFHVQQLGRLLGPGHSGRDTITIVEYRADPCFT